jgi:hypothetical protein
MRVTAGEISKMVQAAMLVEGPTSVARDGGRRGGSDSERTMDRWAHAAANGGLDRGKRQSTSWNQSDDARMRSIGKKIARIMHSAVMNMIEDDVPEHWLTSQELTTVKKMTHQEIVDAITDANVSFRSPMDVATWVQGSNNR